MSRAQRLAAVAFGLLFVATACGGGGGGGGDAASGDTAKGDSIPGLQIERGASREHRQGSIPYLNHPPSGGAHNPVPLTCGFYDQQPPDEFAVHSLEHGAVWIAFGPSLSAADVAVLKAFTKLDHVLVTPYAGMTVPITLVAWERRLEVQSVTDPRIQQFVDAFRNGNNAPERGAACKGVGQPAS